MSKTFIWDEDMLKRRRKRGVVLGLLLGGFALLLVFVTIARIGGAIAQRPSVGFSKGVSDESKN